MASLSVESDSLGFNYCPKSAARAQPHRDNSRLVPDVKKLVGELEKPA
jgi:hypothetical protein